MGKAEAKGSIRAGKGANVKMSLGPQPRSISSPPQTEFTCREYGNKRKEVKKKKGPLHDPGRPENPGRVIVAKKDTSYTERAAREAVLFVDGGVEGSLGGGGVDDREHEAAVTYETPRTTPGISKWSIL
ncbi:hypothetical protein E2C01_056754 [Portunus trituberculatus]|uniref:Uncharacterized protein n=1 Tax=Portunus trituberculatus TaxID=210409 RepID=A0A5B7GZ30_PORTR|nr:hypothetical protein [Portunus trituberculatus]